MIQAQDSPENILKKIEDLKVKLRSDDNILFDLYHSHSPKKDAIRQWGIYLEQLIQMKVLNRKVTEISSIIKDDLHDMKADEAVSWANKVLPNKYKDPKYIHISDDTVRRIESSDNSSKLKPSQIKKINSLYLSRLNHTIANLMKWRRLLETEVPLLLNVDETELEEMIINWSQLNNMVEEIFDNRDKVPLSTQHFLFYANSQTTLSDTYSKYVLLVKDYAKGITPKQVGKILRGEVTNIVQLFDPKTRAEAIASGYYGQKCPECNSFRTIIKFHSEGQATEYVSDDGKFHDRVEKGKFDLF